jgi:hypothetical protein
MSSIFVSLTPGFSRVWTVSRLVKTVSTVFHIMTKIVKTVTCLSRRANTPLKQGVNETEWRTLFRAPKGAN